VILRLSAKDAATLVDDITDYPNGAILTPKENPVHAVIVTRFSLPTEPVDRDLLREIWDHRRLGYVLDSKHFNRMLDRLPDPDAEVPGRG
jgi:hypothetical protein